METTAFGHLTVRFDERVLRPRPWTLAQSLWAAELCADLPAGPILELCAGVGHIGLALATLVDREIVMVDASAAACEYARHNIEVAGLADRVTIRHGAMDAVLDPAERFAFVLADPPWVPSATTGRFPQDPLSAIDGGPDGLDLARVCVRVTAEHLAAGGTSILQLGDVAQVAALRDELAARPALGLHIADVRAGEAWSGVLVQLRPVRAGAVVR